MTGFWNVSLLDTLVRKHSLAAILQFAPEPLALRGLQSFLLLKPPTQAGIDQSTVDADAHQAPRTYPESSPERLGELLAIATRRGSLPCMSILLENGADVARANIPDDNSYNSLLHDAVANKCLSSVKLLLQYGAPVNVPGRSVPNTPLGQAAVTAWLDTPPEPPDWAVVTGLLEIVRLLLQAGASSNITVFFGQSYTAYSHLLEFAGSRHPWTTTLTKALLDYATDLDLAISSFPPESNPLTQVIWTRDYDLIQSALERDDTRPAVKNYVETRAHCHPEMRKFLEERYGFRPLLWGMRETVAGKFSRWLSSIRS
ncbi:ankyrin repeat domain-containing protein [Aspergillus lucknowensis]|uniref:Ankyrin n=1 Tax=Aspergillus lucknowensis TaxID=176173 RepID=A0ABR4LDA4_9EURO